VSLPEVVLPLVPALPALTLPVEALATALSVPIPPGLGDDFAPQGVAPPGGAMVRSGPTGPLGAQPRSFEALEPLHVRFAEPIRPPAPAERAAPRRAVAPAAHAPIAPSAPTSVLAAGIAAPPAGGSGGGSGGAFPLILALLAAYALVPPAGLRRLRRQRVRAPSGIDGQRREHPG
jgi:hypothetical protein